MLSNRFSQTLLHLLIPTLVVAPAPNANAHSKLLSSVPSANQSLTTWPSEIELEFNDELQNIGDQKANFVSAHNALGVQVSLDNEQIEGNKVRVSLAENQTEGPVLIYYRVVSSDGHPIEGEFKFDFGAVKSSVDNSNNVVASQDFPLTIYIASAAFIISGIFFSIFFYRRRNRN
jgi:methionine-rich copper-binding protein CopC